jgi:assimilatory nitrate reductase catalytic subunit
LAFADTAMDWPGFARALVGGNSELAAYHDTQTGRMRFACYEDGKLSGSVFLAPEPVAVAREWAIAQLAGASCFPGKRSRVLAGRAQGAIDQGATVCACFGIGAGEIAGAVGRGCTTVAAVGAATQAGTNCGSCRAEIASIIERQRLAARAVVAPAIAATS